MPSVCFFDSFWPVCNEGGGDAAFVDPVLVFAEGGVGDIGPILTVTNVGLGWSRHDAHSLAEREAFA